MAERPKRIQRKRTKGWRMPPNTVYVGRPTKWGNPFNGPNREWGTEKYRRALSMFPVPQPWIGAWRDCGGNTAMLVALAGRVSPVLDELRGKNLACYCPPDQPCHADILLELANPEGG